MYEVCLKLLQLSPKSRLCGDRGFSSDPRIYQHLLESTDYNYSYNDFLTSVSPEVEIEDMGNGSKKINIHN